MSTRRSWRGPLTSSCETHRTGSRSSPTSLHADAPPADPRSGLRPGKWVVGSTRNPGRARLTQRLGAGRIDDRGSPIRSSSSRAVRTGGASSVNGRLERPVARGLRFRPRGRNARSGEGALAGQGGSGGVSDESSAPSTGCRRWILVGEIGRVPDAADRRSRCLGVLPRRDPDDRARPRHLIRLGRWGDVGQVANDEGGLSLQRKQQRPDLQAAVADGVDLINDPIEQWDLIDAAPRLRVGVQVGAMKPVL